ncbi:TrmH family RNA methyltransferase [Acetobacterium bakii]|uniref:RNA 2-O ribose methyltransferase substrate binding domain-containing protein n=1 Tax=Acetobacterium bakii TaxID=52689 RepID=A0A0L6TY42_9FIRM|nr:RNA methyltransferase [Acetobacterium bakii]KNZ40987.1 hypothetical protein AKG39_14885 [Acetobacterium bakii]
MKSINYPEKTINKLESSIISSRNNEKLKYLRKLRTKSFRDSENLFYTEGTKLFSEALQSNLVFRQIFLTNEWYASQNDDTKDSIAFLTTIGVSVFMVDTEIFNSISTLHQSEGIICIIRKIEFKQTDYTSYIFLDDVQDPYNVGTIIRTADAAGIDCVITSMKTADIYNEKVLRGSMGSVFHIPVHQVASLPEYALTLKKSNVKIIGTSLNGESLWQRQPINKPFGIVMGNESQGMTLEMAELCDILLKIPILGSAESLNVSTAAGIIMYDILRDNYLTE